MCAQLAAIGFDLAQLDEAASKSAEVAELLAASTTDKASDREVKTIRDQAYTCLKQSVDEIRACGQYLFWRNQERLRGYKSEYFRAKAAKSAADQAATPTIEPSA